MRRVFFFFTASLAFAQVPPGPLTNAAPSPSGTFAAFQNLLGDVWLFNSANSAKTLLLSAPSDPATLEWASTGDLLLVNRPASITIFQAPSAKIRFNQQIANAFPQISPDARYLTTIRNHNLWLTPLSHKRSKPITTSTSPNILNGDPDPVFAHEFNTGPHYWWAPDSSAIAYLETQFQTANHYPKPGEALPTFRLKLIDIHSAAERIIAESSPEWPYILRVAFHPDSHQIAFYRLNRLQTQVELRLADTTTGLTRTLFTDKDDYWYNAPATPVFLAQGKQIAITSERSGHRHVYLYNLDDGALLRDLTPPDLDIAELLRTTGSQDAVFVTASTGTHQEQHFYRLNSSTTEATQLTKLPGWHSISIAPNGAAFLDSHSTTLHPPTLQWHTASSSRRISTERINDGSGSNEYLPIKTHDGVLLPARLFKPANFDQAKKYPVIIYTFSGPAGRVVSDSWDQTWQMSWNETMISKGYLVLAVDVRGSGGYNHLFEEYIHYRFGAQETVDLREVVTYLRSQPFVAPNRIGIWGCNYGAHTIIHAMFEFPHGFKAGFADSPITDWHSYNAYFTERYLGLPANHRSEYDDSSALENAKRVTGNLLVATDPINPFILPDHTDALRKAVAEVKTPGFEKHVTFYPNHLDRLTKLLAAMTDFFSQNL